MCGCKRVRAYVHVYVGVNRVSAREREQGSKAPIMIRSVNDHFGFVENNPISSVRKEKNHRRRRNDNDRKDPKKQFQKKRQKRFFSDRLKIQL